MACVLSGVMLASLTGCMAGTAQPTNASNVSPPAAGQDWLVPDLKNDRDRGALGSAEYEQQKLDALPQRK
ncbi:MAG: hypothetical protein WCI73_14265 [Phycisphaerae bacterium]